MYVVQKCIRFILKSLMIHFSTWAGGPAFCMGNLPYKAAKRENRGIFTEMQQYIAKLTFTKIYYKIPFIQSLQCGISAKTDLHL